MLIFQKILNLFIISLATIVVFSVSPLYSIFCLILIFCIIGICLVILNLEFLGVIYILVYAGGVLVLFVFTILSYSLKDLFFSIKATESMSVIFLVGSLITFDVLEFGISASQSDKLLNKNYFYSAGLISDIPVFSLNLYSQLFPFLIISGVILLLVMLGVILLTLDTNLYKIQQDYRGRSLRTISITK